MPDQTSGWQVRPPGDRGAKKRVHYIELGISACYLVGSNTLALVPEPEAGSNVCKSCTSALLAREEAR